MAVDAVDRRFALIADNNEALYPYKKAQLRMGRYGFALSAPGDRDAHGGGEYTDDLKEVVARVVFDGWKVRATTIHRGNKQRDGSFMLHGKAIVGYWIADDLKHLVEAAPTRPIALSKDAA